MLQDLDLTDRPGMGWCATKVDKSGTSTEYGYCVRKCTVPVPIPKMAKMALLHKPDTHKSGMNAPDPKSKAVPQFTQVFLFRSKTMNYPTTLLTPHPYDQTQPS
jgi:hypothetical protein